MTKKTILLVDDTRLFIEQEISLLNRSDFEVLVADNGVEASKIIAEKKPDIVFMDLYMPGMNGDRCCRTIKSDKNLCHIPIIMVIQGTNQDDFERCWQAGCDDIVVKPINEHLFMAQVKRYLNIQLRKSPRYSTRLRILYNSDIYPDRILSNYSVNLSTGGMFIETDDLLPVGSPLNIEFILPKDGRVIKCSGRVSWLNAPDAIIKQDLPAGMGLQFINLSLDDMDSLRNFIKKQTLTADW
ncbi:MAG: response regulator [Desulfuromonadaceae bacterium]|nr:response regulator [Desulfuromonadaceae bacterium]